MDGIVADNPILPEMIDQLLARNHSIAMLGQVPENAHGQRLHRRNNAVSAHRVRSKIDYPLTDLQRFGGIINCNPSHALIHPGVCSKCTFNSTPGMVNQRALGSADDHA
jgi:hypothetical protein